MRILILGSGSFAGQALFSTYLKRGLDVFGINRSDPKDGYQWPWVKSFGEIKRRWFKYDLSNSVDSIIEIVKEIDPQIIIDFMGEGMVAPSWINPDIWYTTNLAKKSKLLNSFLNLKNLKRYIRASTPEVYGSNEDFLNELSSFCPSTPYAVSHAGIDMHIRCLGKQYEFPFVIGRFANFYGVGQQLYRVIPKLFLSCKSKKTFTLDGGGKSARSFIFSEDIINAFDCILETNSVYEEFNFSSQEEISIDNLVTKVCDISNTKREEIIRNGPERPGKDKFYRLDISKAKSSLNWTPSISLEEGLSDVDKWITSSYDALSVRSWEYSN